MDAVIISVGTELVIGQCVDTNSAWLSEQLNRLGVNVIRHVTVGDELMRIRTVIEASLAEASLVLITGGMGPTADDLTREALAEALGEPLEERRDALEQIQAFFARWQRSMPESNRRQAMIPRGCSVISNERGTAPGIAYERGERLLFALPGVPAEMKAMFDQTVRPVVRGRTGTATTHEINLRCYGISEAALGDAIADLMARGRNPMVGTTASGAVLTVRIVAHGAHDAAAHVLADADANEVRSRLGHAVFGEGSDVLESAVGRLLALRDETVAVAESCTGGLLGARLTDVPGSSAYFLRGNVTYSNRAKVDLLGVPETLLDDYGAVSEAVARAMAEGCRQRAGADYAVSVTGIAGPTGGTPDKPVGLVFIGLATQGGVEVRRFLFGEHLTRSEIRDRSCKTALNLLRLRLLDTPAEGRP
jgi:nicotinamide-nucleotide amidase